FRPALFFQIRREHCCFVYEGFCNLFPSKSYHITEVCPAEVCPAEVCSAEECPAEVRPAEVCSAEVCPAEVCPAEVCSAEVCQAEVCPAEACPTEVCPFKKRVTKCNNLLIQLPFLFYPLTTANYTQRRLNIHTKSYFSLVRAGVFGLLVVSNP